MFIVPAVSILHSSKIARRCSFSLTQLRVNKLPSTSPSSRERSSCSKSPVTSEFSLSISDPVTPLSSSVPILPSMHDFWTPSQAKIPEKVYHRTSTDISNPSAVHLLGNYINQFPEVDSDSDYDSEDEDDYDEELDSEEEEAVAKITSKPKA